MRRLIIPTIMLSLATVGQAWATTFPDNNGGVSTGATCQVIVSGIAQPCSNSNPLPVSASVSASVAPIATSVTNASTTIATGGTFQQVLASNTARQSLTVQNNNTTGSGSPGAGVDYCWVTTTAFGSATKATSIALAPGGSWTSSSLTLPSNAIAVTCATTGDYIYVAWQ